MKEIVLALDCMGGEHAPLAAIRGAELILATYPDLRFILVGDENKIKPIAGRLLISKSEILHTMSVIGDADKPTTALRRSEGTSMRVAIEQVASSKASCVISAGNTGGLMAISLYILRTMEHVDRPALAAFMPSFSGPVVLLDVGANVSCGTNLLVQFAIMGNAWAKAMYQDKPKVGLLNIGAEENKGNDSIREAYRILRTLPMDFVGYVEPNNIPKGEVRVVVCDGLLGNIALKAAEGLASFLHHSIKEAFNSSLFNKAVGFFAAKALRSQLSPIFDVRKRRGGVLLGLNGNVVKAHGSYNADGFASAIEQAIELSGRDVSATIAQDVAAMHNILAGNSIL